MTSLFQTWAEGTPIRLVDEIDGVHCQDNPMYQWLPLFRERWNSQTIQFERDAKEFLKMEERYKIALHKLMVFFLFSENGINENLGSLDEFENSMLMKSLFAAQADMECIHAETYSRQFQALVPMRSEMIEIIDRYKDADVIQSKLAFMRKYMGEGVHLLEKIFSFVVSEGILFQSSFAAIYAFDSKRDVVGHLEGVKTANDYISKDEGLHCRLFAKIFKELEKSYSSTLKINFKFKEMLQEAKQIELEYLRFVADFDNYEHFLGYTYDEFAQYIDYVAQSVEELVFGTENTGTQPFSFMVEYNALKKVIQFECEGVSYISVGKTVTKENIDARTREMMDEL